MLTAPSRLARLATALFIALVFLAGCGQGGSSGDVAAALRGQMQSFAQAVRTVWVCKGLTWPPDGCDTLDTSTIGGRPLSDFKITRPGTLLFDLNKRRSELNSEPAASNMCLANPVMGGPPSTLAYGFSKAIVFESPLGDGLSRQSADMEFANLTTSDGLVLPRFGFILNQERGQPFVSLQFRPSVDANLAGIPGLTEDVVLSVDMTTGAVTEANFTNLPDPLKNLLAAVAGGLPALYDGVNEVEVRPGNQQPLWTMTDIKAMAVKFSQAARLLGQPVFEPVLTFTCAGASCLEGAAVNRFREYLIRYGAQYLQTGDGAIAAGLLSNLRAWASAGALTQYPGYVVGQPGQDDFRPKYELMYVLTPMIQTWALVRQDALVSAADRSLIDGWFDTLVAYATEPAGGAGSQIDPFNVGYLSTALDMEWGIVRGDDARFQRGVERYYAGLHQMRADGSFPREVSRGACSLRYQDTMLLHLNFIAELAAQQGYDLHALEVDGKSLHTAVKFLLDAVADPQVILAYASQDPGNCNVGPAVTPFDLDGVTSAPLGFSYSAWLEPYVARFPAHANAARLKNLLQGGLDKNRPIYHPHAGGNTSCFAIGSKPQLPAKKLDCLFDWAAVQYSSFLPAPASSSAALGPYFFRRYGDSPIYLGVSSNDDRLYYLSPSLGMADLGPVDNWMSTSSCR